MRGYTRKKDYIETLLLEKVVPVGFLLFNLPSFLGCGSHPL